MQNEKNENKGAGSDDETSSLNEDETPCEPSENKDTPEDAPEGSTKSVKVEYCPVCTFPFEYCEYAGMMEQCKPHLMEWMKRTSQTPDHDVKAGVSLEDKVKPKKKVPEGVEKMLPGGKVKKKEESIVLITVASRQKRKCVTTVTGLEHFGVKLSDAAKEFKKMFSCGASVVKTPSGKEQIDIQGEFRDQLLEMWTKKFKEIPKEMVFTMDEGKTKVPAFE
eukprot:GGOE01061501.1.p1 GENE.GGOE01061501.1~~GGOE01061501.1.p1  ORF type:complete len:221 (+),score=26.30 GGOE01061501.1:400-1062(+)